MAAYRSGEPKVPAFFCRRIVNSQPGTGEYLAAGHATRPTRKLLMAKKAEQPLYSAAWARWKKRIADGWGPVSALIVEDIEPTEPKFKIGDTVKLDHGSVPSIGTIEEIDRTHGCVFYGVRFSISDKRWLAEDNLQAAPAYLPAVQ